MITFIDQHRHTYGVESICDVLPIPVDLFPAEGPPARSRAAIGTRATGRGAQGDHSPHLDGAASGLRRTESLEADGPRRIARGTLSSPTLDARAGAPGCRTGTGVDTTHPDAATARPADLVERRFTATRPNQLWVANPRTSPSGVGFVYGVRDRRLRTPCCRLARPRRCEPTWSWMRSSKRSMTTALATSVTWCITVIGEARFSPCASPSVWQTCASSRPLAAAANRTTRWPSPSLASSRPRVIWRQGPVANAGGCRIRARVGRLVQHATAARFRNDRWEGVETILRLRS